MRLSNFYNLTFWFLRLNRTIFFSYKTLPISSIIIYDNYELYGSLNKKYYSFFPVVFHGEFIVLLNVIFLLNSKYFKNALILSSLQPCFFCCFLFLKFRFFCIYFFTPKKSFCYFLNILYFFFKKNGIFFCNVNINLSFLNFVLLHLFFFIRRKLFI